MKQAENAPAKSREFSQNSGFVLVRIPWFRRFDSKIFHAEKSTTVTSSLLNAVTKYLPLTLQRTEFRLSDGQFTILC